MSNLGFLMIKGEKSFKAPLRVFKPNLQKSQTLSSNGMLTRFSKLISFHKNRDLAPLHTTPGHFLSSFTDIAHACFILLSYDVCPWLAFSA
jgi:hypothetical protein